jgi:hypothetical protein
MQTVKAHLKSMFLVVVMSLLLPAQAGDLEDADVAIKAGECDARHFILIYLDDLSNNICLF